MSNKWHIPKPVRLMIFLAALMTAFSGPLLFAGPPIPEPYPRTSTQNDDEIEDKTVVFAERYVDLIDELEDVLKEYEDFFQQYGLVSMKEYEKSIKQFRESLGRKYSAESYNEMMDKLDNLIDKLDEMDDKSDEKSGLQSRDLRNLRSLGYDLEDIREELRDEVGDSHIRMDIDPEELSRAISRAMAEAARAMKEAQKAYQEQLVIPVPPVPPAAAVDPYRHVRELNVPEFSATLTHSTEAAISGKDIAIDLDNPLGGVTIQTWNKSEVNALLTVGYSEGSKRSRNLAEEIKLVIEESPGTTTIKVVYPDKDDETVNIVSSLLEVSLPRSNPVKITNSFGAVSVHDLNNRLDISSGFSTVDIQRIKGDVGVNNSSGSVYLEEVTGRADISNSFGPIEIVYLKGDGILSNSYAPITIKRSEGRIDVSTSGLVSINHHTGDADIHSSNGEMDIYAVKGNLIAVNSFGKMRVEDVSGDAEIENANAETEVTQIGGRLTVSNKFAPITVENVGKDLTVKSSNGRITVNGVKGNVNIANRFGEVSVESIGGTVRITNANAPVTVSDVQAPVNVVNLFGPVYIAGVTGNVDVDNQNASVDLVDIEGASKVSTTFGMITGENLGGPFIIANSNGSVELTRVMSISADCEITTTFGDIILELPQNKKFNLLAKTTYGEIKSDLPLKMTSSGNISSGEMIIGQADPTVKLTGKSSTIKIITK